MPGAGGPPALDAVAIARAVRAALEEDLGREGDVTSAAAVPADRRAAGRIVARAGLVLAGVDVARAVFHALDPAIDYRAPHADGERLATGDPAAFVAGRARAILAGERTALNFLMRMSGIATATAAAVEEIAGTGARILDTRKTAPGLRALDKYAVACGGGENHRRGLYDAVLLKDTHLGAGGTIEASVRRALAAGHPAARITVEIHHEAQIDEALAAGAGRLLLDNMTPAAVERAVARVAGRATLEVSGGLRPGRLRPFAETGVEFLSLGWLTHSAPAADLALELGEP
jgi:nicotinate-nucleotide pyrophosphorylase (carboxylating)